MQLPTKSAETDRRWATLAATWFVVALVGYRLLIGAGLGLGPSEAGASGVIQYPEDNFAYLSYVEQVKAGVFPFVNSFAGAMDQDAVYANPLFLVLGLIAATFGLPAAAALVLAGLFAAGLTVYTAHGLAEDAGLGRTTSRWAAALVMFGSGLSAIVALLSDAGSHDWIGVDRTHGDAIAFSTFVVYPFQSITLAILALLMRALVRRARVMVVFWSLASALARPYESILCVASYAVFAALSRVGDRRRRLEFCCIAATTVLPVIGYSFWVGTEPAWAEYSKITTDTIDIGRRAWLTGYGMFLPAALLGVLATRRPGESGTRTWFSIWVGILVTLLVVVDIDQVKLASGAQLPLAILAAHGCAELTRRISTIDVVAIRRGLAAIAVGAFACFLPTTAHLLTNIYSAHHLPHGLVAVANSIRGAQTPDNPLPLVLCDRETGTLLPGLVGCRVHVGHWSMTPSRGERIARLYEAGIDSDSARLRAADATEPSPQALERLTRELQPTFVLLRDSAPARAFPIPDGWTALDGTGRGFTLFRLEPAD